MLIAAIFALSKSNRPQRDALAHISTAELAELVQIYRQDIDKPGFMEDMRGQMIAHGISDADADARIASFLAHEAHWR